MSENYYKWDPSDEKGSTNKYIDSKKINIPYKIDYKKEYNINRKLPVYYLPKQAYVESTFDSNAVSPRGALGLTQIMPSVIKDFEKKTGKTIDPFNPDHAIEVQKHQMNWLAKRPYINHPESNDSIFYAKVLAGYNMGGENLRKSLNKQKELGVDIHNSWNWLDTLPNETKNYVNKILRNNNPKFNQEFENALKNFKYKDRWKTY